MKKLNFFFGLLALLMLFSCATTKNRGTSEEKALLADFIEKKEFNIESTWARPLATTSFTHLLNTGLLPPGSSANNINLIGNDNYFKMKGDSVAIALPFYGERRRGGGYNQTAGIEYEGTYDDFKIEHNGERFFYKLNLEVKKDTELLQFTIWLYDNLKSVIALNSSDRTYIDFDGSVSVLNQF